MSSGNPWVDDLQQYNDEWSLYEPTKRSNPRCPYCGCMKYHREDCEEIAQERAIAQARIDYLTKK